jgi:hypothetical protein
VRLLALAAAAALVLPASALAAADAELSVMDDQALLGRSQAQIEQTLGRMQSLGATRLRVSAFWSDIAPSPLALSKPQGFDASDPYDPRYRFADLDRVVGSAAARHIHVLISLSSPIPYWASSKPALRNRVWDPNPAEFARFSRAVAARYATVVDQFAVLNEPNQGGWLQPQSLAGKAVAPHLYRELARAAYPAIKGVAPTATVLVGELAPSGRNDPGPTRPIRPLAFLRQMGCRDARWRAIRTGRCKGFQPMPLDAIGHHPYSVFLSPFQRSRYADDATMGDWRRLESTLDRLVARGALAPSGAGRLQIHYTEFGYQTDPPDPYSGIPLKDQSRWLQDAAYMTWKTPRVHALNQFRLTDGPIRGTGPKAFLEFQTGLWFASGRPKPSATTFGNPIVLRRAGRSRLLLWGQARPGQAPHQVVLERRAPGTKAFRQIAVVTTDGRGYFQRWLPFRGGAYRFRWSDFTGQGASEAVSSPR